MYSTVLPDAIEAGIQAMYQTVLTIFFVLTILGWLAAVRVWRKEDEAAAEADEEHSEG